MFLNALCDQVGKALQEAGAKEDEFGRELCQRLFSKKFILGFSVDRRPSALVDAVVWLCENTNDAIACRKRVELGKLVFQFIEGVGHIDEARRLLNALYNLNSRVMGAQNTESLMLAKMHAVRADDNLDWSEAKLWCLRMLEANETMSSTDNAQGYLYISYALQSLAALCLREKDYNQARSYALKDLDLLMKYAKSHQASLALSLENLADIEAETGYITEATRYRKMQLTILEQTYGLEDPRVKKVKAQI